eukprot:CAMPEP_0116853444 /NCGR_PEP_ID=MMETSP0418-20121206/17917_1 /TAXON_ID=1158023 /ORGANISM="Astrosyne radiata, Strain 13vi08-1A" /LENGTH=187 /DNA_ID=CAMNT_0004485849 /DNA_START=1 /DNA_END=564 /DNA_ORIENTATION=-
MEMAILRALSWHVHPPTTFCLARHFLHILPSAAACSPAAKHDILELARFLTELSVIDYFFVTKRASSVALAALLDAMDTLGSIDHATRRDFLCQLKRLNDFDPEDPEIEQCRHRLRDLYNQGGYNRAEEIQRQATPPGETRNATVSPVCVASAFDPHKEVVAGQVKANYPQAEPAYYVSQEYTSTST